MIGNTFFYLFALAFLILLGSVFVAFAGIILAGIGIMALAIQQGLQQFQVHGFVLSPEDAQALHYVLVGIAVVLPVIVVVMIIAAIASHFDKDEQIRRTEEKLRRLKGDHP